MALQGWDKNYREQLKIQQQEIESLQQKLMIGEKQDPYGNDRQPNQYYPDWQEEKPHDPFAAPNIREVAGHPPGELPPYVPPDKPSSPWEPGKSPAPSRKMAGLQINPNSIMLPFVPKDAETDEDYGEGDVPGHPDWKLSHGEGRGPQPQYHDEYNRELPIPPWMQMFPDGELREIPWMKEKYLNEHPELFAGATSRQIRDRLKPFTHGKGYDKDGGSMQGVPDALRIQLLRDAMA